MNEAKYEAVLRFPTDQYAFIEIKVNDTPEAILEAWGRFKSLTAVQTGLPIKDFDQFIENQISGKPNHMETYEKMSEEQKRHVQTNKRAMKRIISKLDKQE